MAKKRDDVSLVEFEAGHSIDAVVFSANGEHLFTGGVGGVRVWRVQDGKKITTMRTSTVCCLAVSQDGKYVGAGTWNEVLVWDANTYKHVTALEADGSEGVDFSADATRLVTAGYNTATVCDVATRREVFVLKLDKDVIAAKYSPRGDRIATATEDSVRVWDGNDGKLLVNINVQVVSWYNRGLLWLQNYLFVVSDKKIIKFDASTGSTVLEWPINDTSSVSCIGIPQHGRFIVHSSDEGAVTFWSTSSHSQLFRVQSEKGKHLIAISSGNRFLASAGGIRKVAVSRLLDIDPTSPFLLPTFQDPEIGVDDEILDAWQDDQLTHAEGLLSARIAMSDTIDHQALACRALIRTRLGKFDTAIVDAETSIRNSRSVIGHIAKCVALVHRGDKDKGLQACDIAFQYFYSSYTTTLLLTKAIVFCLVGEYENAVSRLDDLVDAVDFNSSLYVVQAHMHLLEGDAHMESDAYDLAIRAYQHARTKLGTNGTKPLSVVSLISGWKFEGLGVKIRQRLCEAFYTAGRINEASQVILETVDEFPEEEVRYIADWVTDFMRRCLSFPENSDGDSYTADIHVCSQSPIPLLKAWARLRVSVTSWKESLDIATSFTCPKRAIYQSVCERLEDLNEVGEAVACLHKMNCEVGRKMDDEQAKWASDFKLRCLDKLNELGDKAIKARQYDDAILHYTAALSLGPGSPRDVFIQRSKAYAGNAMWEKTLNDANQAIELDPSSPCGYQRKHVALHGLERDENAADVFETMLQQMAQSPDPFLQDRSRRCIRPSQLRDTIRDAVQRITSKIPLVLIDTKSGRLLNKSAQATSFESQPIFHELISSITVNVDQAFIDYEVGQYYQYVTFSHKWEDNEPLYDKVVHGAVYNLEGSPTHNKLMMFCKIVRDDGFNWAWSDTCCIDKRDHFVMQESLVSMFKWYQGAAMTIIFLLGVRRASKWGDLTESIWNKRAWTLQEYHASKVVRFYTKDWTLYMNLTIHNHKESPEIISEMEKATAVPPRVLMSLRPGIDDIREKLCLASTRKTTRIEDAAYSLLGIFSITLPVVYGEGDKALGRLLAQLLMSSGDMSILAWTGRSGSFNSCLPASISVFKDPATSYIPPAITSDLETSTNLSSANIKLAMQLYDGLRDLPIPMLMGQRMKVPCIRFELGSVTSTSNGSRYVFRAQSSVLGVVEIRTEENLSRLGPLYLIHPWMDFLLDRQPVGGIPETPPMGSRDIDEASSTSTLLLGELSSFSDPPATLRKRAAKLVSLIGLPFSRQGTISSRDSRTVGPSSTIQPADRQTRARGLIARLRQPFGALLLTPTRRNVEYRRVASECLITVRVQEVTPAIMDSLIQGVQVLDVL